jgi:serine/threonine-protein kinase RsbW
MYLEFALCLPREAHTVALIRRAVTDILALHGVDAECVEDIRLAVSEACSNVVVHAASDDEYQVVIRVEGGQCFITVKNTGHGFDSDSLTGEMPDPTSARGRGVAIMHSVMSGVDLASYPESGTVVRLVRDLSFSEPSSSLR